MSDAVAIVVPVDRETARLNGERAAAWWYVRSRLFEEYGEDVAICVGYPRNDWCKAEAIEDALFLVDEDVIVVHDADVYVSPGALRSAMAMVSSGAPWAVPHTMVRRLTEEATEQLVRTRTVDHDALLARWPYEGILGGGVVVVQRDVYDDCPLDRRFVGWGGEDQAWGWALGTLYGEPWRGDADLWHLWHPHATGLANPQRPTRTDSELLRRRYRQARGSPDAMRAIVAGGR